MYYKHEKNIILLSLIFILSVLSGCGVYNPQLIDIPLIQEKKDLRIDAGVSINVPSVRSSISYGITDKLAINVFGSFGSDYRYYLQVAPGIYKKRAESLIQELYGGFGLGYGSSYKSATGGSLDGNYQLYFAQYNIGKVSTNNSSSEFGFSFRSGIMHADIVESYYFDPLSYGNAFDSYSVLLEPSILGRFGKGRLKFSINLGASYLIKIQPIKKYTTFDLINFGFGLNYRL